MMNTYQYFSHQTMDQELTDVINTIQKLKRETYRKYSQN